MALVGEQIPDYVQKQIEVRQAAYGSGSLSDFPRTDEILTYSNSKNAFIKMASGVSVSGSKLEELGFGGADIDTFKGMGLAKEYVLFGGVSRMSQINNDRGGTDGILSQRTGFIGIDGAYNTDSDFGIIPMPGIESLEIKSLNRGSLKKATIKLTAQSRTQLAILDVLYMRLGYTVLIEWGNTIYLNKDGNLQKMYTSIIEDNDLFFNKTWSSKRSYRDITSQISRVRELYDGNFDALLGKVSNFNWSFNPDGSYSIELTVISLGDVVESLKTNVPAAYNTLNYVNTNGTGWKTEDDTLDQHRKDNIILSLLHVLRILNQTPTGPKISISTKDSAGVDQPIAWAGNLLLMGGNIIKTSDHVVTLTMTRGFRDKTTKEFIDPNTIAYAYFQNNGTPCDPLATGRDNLNQCELRYAWKRNGLSVEIQNGNAISVREPGDSVGSNYGDILFESLQSTRSFTESKTFSQVEFDEFNSSKTPLVDFPSNPMSIFIKEFLDKYGNVPLRSTKKITYSGNTQEYKGTNILDPQFVSKLGGDLEARLKAANIEYDPGHYSRSGEAKNVQNIDNPLKGTGYEDNDAFVLNLDKPQYYIRFGYLLDLIKQKVITRINTGQKEYNKNPNIFDIDTTDENNLMLCLPLQISYDWRTCIVRRNNFDRENSWQQKIFPQLKQWFRPGTNTAYSMNVYLNFNFIAESMTSNSDERGNISVYDFIKSMCDGINKSMAGVNNLEPIIDEDSNTLRIFESSPIPKPPVNPGYKLQLYGYGNGVTSPAGNSTFVRKVDLKTAITPEYATMITVGATANGYVKGTEATAFARWNEGLTDRFKTELIAADSETKDNENNGSRDDTVNSFQSVMSWTSKCFGIEGAGRIWECFPNK